MPIGRFSAGVNDSFGAGFSAEIIKIAKKKGRKEKGRQEKGSRKNRLLRTLVGAGVGGAGGASLIAGIKGVRHAKRTAMFNAIKPLVRALGPEASKVFRKHFKPRYLKPSLFKGMAVGGALGAIPAAAIASIL